jgi:hypothetical protein
MDVFPAGLVSERHKKCGNDESYIRILTGSRIQISHVSVLDFKLLIMKRLGSEM